MPAQLYYVSTNLAKQNTAANVNAAFSNV